MCREQAALAVFDKYVHQVFLSANEFIPRQNAILIT